MKHCKNCKCCPVSNKICCKFPFLMRVNLIVFHLFAHRFSLQPSKSRFTVIFAISCVRNALKEKEFSKLVKNIADTALNHQNLGVQVLFGTTEYKTAWDYSLFFKCSYLHKSLSHRPDTKQFIFEKLDLIFLRQTLRSCIQFSAEAFPKI